MQTLPMTHRDYPLTETLARLLDNSSGSPLREHLQDRTGLCYSLSAGLDGFEHAAALHIDFSVHPRNTIEAVTSCLEVLQELRNTPLTQERMDHLHHQYVKATRLAGHDLWYISSRCATRRMFHMAHTFPQEFRSTQLLNPKRLFSLCRACLQGKNFALSLTGKGASHLRRPLRHILEAFPG